MKLCSFCENSVQDGAINCKHCGRVLTSEAPSEDGSRTSAVMDPDVLRLLASGNKLAAMAFLQERAGMELTAAAQIVEFLSQPAGEPQPPDNTAMSCQVCKMVVPDGTRACPHCGNARVSKAL